MVTPSAKQVYKSVIGSLPSLPLNFELSQSSAFYKKLRLAIDSMSVITFSRALSSPLVLFSFFLNDNVGPGVIKGLFAGFEGEDRCALSANWYLASSSFVRTCSTPEEWL